jgi:hypothetical protein
MANTNISKVRQLYERMIGPGPVGRLLILVCLRHLQICCKLRMIGCQDKCDLCKLREIVSISEWKSGSSHVTWVYCTTGEKMRPLSRLGIPGPRTPILVYRRELHHDGPSFIVVFVSSIKTS